MNIVQEKILKLCRKHSISLDMLHRQIEYLQYLEMLNKDNLESNRTSEVSDLEFKGDFR